MVYGFIVVVLVLIIVCFCVLGLVMLMLIMVGVGKGVQVGVLIKNVEVFECFEKVDMLVVDKIGMFMEGLFMVIGIISFSLGGEIFFLCVIVVVEKGLQYLLGMVVVRVVYEKGIVIFVVSNFNVLLGKGVLGDVEG